MSAEPNSRADDDSANDAPETDVPPVDDGSDSDNISEDIDALRARVAVLSEENSRLRREYARARQLQHRRTSLGLALIGAVALAGALVFAHVRTVLLVLAATGLFGAVLTYFLTPERFVPANVSERVYSAFGDNFAQIVTALGLQGRRLYLPYDEDSDTPVRLFVPQRQEYVLPSGEELERPFSIDEENRSRGLILIPTGGRLFEEFRRSVSGELGENPAVIGTQAADALVESFEIASEVSVDTADGQLTAGVSGSAYGDPERFDHPIPSMIAAGLAVQLSEPIEVSSRRTGDERADVVFTFRWGDTDADYDSPEP